MLISLKKFLIYLIFIFIFLITSSFVLAQEECPFLNLGNLNCDNQGVINNQDLAILLQCWGNASGECLKASLNRNESLQVNETDLTILLKNWGGRIDFYGQKISFIKLFGQFNFGETSHDTVVPYKIHHASGVFVDKNRQPNAVYVVDTGNNRVLGFKSLGRCKNHPTTECTNDTDCPSGGCEIISNKPAGIIFGQPDEKSAACNGDNNLGISKSASSTSLCLMGFPQITNVGEYWMRTNFDVDGEGNLYIPDVWNNRILKYNQPFSENKINGRGDNVADFVWGQDNFSDNQVNRGRGKDFPDDQSIFISSGGFDHVASRGVSVDLQGNVWVADTFNFRVLRFPPSSKKANLVLGQENFTIKNHECSVAPNSRSLNRFCTPTFAKIDPETGKLYVIDESPRGFKARILVFSPPFSNGMGAEKVISPKQDGSFLNYDWQYYFQATGFTFNTYKEGEYAQGKLWVNEHQINRTILIDDEGNIIKVIGAPNKYYRGCDYGNYNRCGQNIFQSFNLCWPGGMIGIDNANNIYLADETFNRIARFSLPYNVSSNNCLPTPNAGLFLGTTPNSVSGYKFTASVGTIPFKSQQLIAKDPFRYLVWNNYLEKGIGEKADFIIGQENENIRTGNDLGERSLHTIDDQNRLWAFNGSGKIIVYQLPFRENNQPPLANDVPLYWRDTDKLVDYNSFESGLAFDKINKAIWITDRKNHRLLRVSNYNNFRGKLYVDAVLGQPDKNHTKCNHDQEEPGEPTASSLCHPYALQFDKFGNLYVIENTYECHGNDRIVVFLAEDLRRINTLFPQLEAKKVFIASDFTHRGGCIPKENEPHSPVAIAFNSKNEMVIGNDGYYINENERHLKQLWFYQDPLKRNADGSFVQGQKPDAYIKLPMGAPGEIWFDEQDNLVIQDHTWAKVWVINLEKDPSWLVPIR